MKYLEMKFRNIAKKAKDGKYLNAIANFLDCGNKKVEKKAYSLLMGFLIEDQELLMGIKNMFVRLYLKERLKEHLNKKVSLIELFNYESFPYPIFKKSFIESINMEELKDKRTKKKWAKERKVLLNNTNKKILW